MEGMQNCFHYLGVKMIAHAQMQLRNSVATDLKVVWDRKTASIHSNKSTGFPRKTQSGQQQRTLYEIKARAACTLTV